MNTQSNKIKTSNARKVVLIGVVGAIFAATSMFSIQASAKDFKPPSLGPQISPQSGLPVGKNFQPGPLKPPSLPVKPIGPIVGGCAGTKLGCNPTNNSGAWAAVAGVAMIGLTLAAAEQNAEAAQQNAEADDNCYYTIKRVYDQDYGMVRKRFLVCD